VSITAQVRKLGDSQRDMVFRFGALSSDSSIELGYRMQLQWQEQVSPPD